MKTGALIFAYNNTAVNYVNMAAWSAQRIQKWLDIPVTLVTDQPVGHAVFDQVLLSDRVDGNTRHYRDFDDHHAWYNMDCCDALSLSPYERTLVIDADYVVNSDALRIWLHHGPHFVSHRHAFDVVKQQRFNQHFGAHDMPQWWATVMIFDRSRATDMIFRSMKMIRDNWSHYVDIYKIHRNTFRNDYALSVALALTSGHSLVSQDLPWDLFSIMPEHDIKMLDDHAWQVGFSDQGKSRYIVLRDVDFHAMGKRQLGDIIANQG